MPPLHVEKLLGERLPPGERLAATKIDVEGYEIHVLEALRPAWHLLGDVIVEMQPRAWSWQNISVDDALDTLSTLVKQRGYRIVSLTHDTSEGVGKTKATPYPDVCQLPMILGEMAVPRGRSGSINHVGGKLAELDVDGLRAVLRFMLHHPRKMGYFRDYLLTNRTCANDANRTAVARALLAGLPPLVPAGHTPAKRTPARRAKRSPARRTPKPPEVDPSCPASHPRGAGTRCCRSMDGKGKSLRCERGEFRRPARRLCCRRRPPPGTLALPAQPAKGDVAQSEVAAAPPRGRGDALDMIMKLVKLKEAGALTEAEFAAKKAELLKQV